MAPESRGGPPQPAGYGSAAGHGSAAGYGPPTSAPHGGSAAAPPSRQARPPVPRRVSSRRPIPPLIFIVVLAVVALGVWFKVLQNDQARPTGDADACPAPPTVSAVDPATVRLRVLNASETEGLAAQVSAEFVGRGFAVLETDNDRSGRTVLAIGELRYGPRGAEQAAFVALFTPGITLVRDTRSDDLIDIALGPEFTTLATPEAVAIAIATPVAPTDLACATGNPSETVTDEPPATS